MRRTNLFFGAGALLVAAGAIGAGVMVSTNAMAASGDLGDHALTIGMVTVGINGDAYECSFDAASVPVLPTAPSGAAGDAPAFITSAVGGGVPEGATVVSGGHVLGSGPDGSLPPLLPSAGGPGGSGGVIITGSANADGTSSVSQVAADGTITPVKVRQGTAAECAAAQQGIVPPSGGPQAPTVVSGSAPTDTALNPKG